MTLVETLCTVLAVGYLSLVVVALRAVSLSRQVHRLENRLDKVEAILVDANPDALKAKEPTGAMSSLAAARPSYLACSMCSNRGRPSCPDGLCPMHCNKYCAERAFVGHGK